MNDIPCPACGRDSVLVRALDALMHVDGSENLTCWGRTTRGDVPTPPGLEPNCCPGRVCRPWNLRELRRHLDRLDREAAA